MLFGRSRLCHSAPTFSGLTLSTTLYCEAFRFSCQDLEVLLLCILSPLYLFSLGARLRFNDELFISTSVVSRISSPTDTLDRYSPSSNSPRATIPPEAALAFTIIPALEPCELLHRLELGAPLASAAAPG